MTLIEILVASSLGLAVTAMVLGFFLMTKERVRSGQVQVLFNMKARYGAEKIMRLIQASRIAAPYSNGKAAYIINPDDSVTILSYRDEDGQEDTIQDNAIWMDTTPDEDGDEVILVPFVTPLPGEWILGIENAGLAVRFHVGDPGAETSADAFSGSGNQGVQIRVVAKPRNIGQIWTSSNF